VIRPVPPPAEEGFGSPFRRRRAGERPPRWFPAADPADRAEPPDPVAPVTAAGEVGRDVDREGDLDADRDVVADAGRDPAAAMPGEVAVDGGSVDAGVVGDDAVTVGRADDDFAGAVGVHLDLDVLGTGGAPGASAGSALDADAATHADADPEAGRQDREAAVLAGLGELAGRLDELSRLRRHDAELVDRLHAENTRLRQGELTDAMRPLLRGLIRLHDQMSSLGADDPQSVAGILRRQLLQILDVTSDVRPYTAVPGSPFDPARHLALRGVRTDEPDRDRTIARTVRPGFVRGAAIVVRPAETEVYRAR
jgi:molecular chaperone GrpE (heat shock protein)